MLRQWALVTVMVATVGCDASDENLGQTEPCAATAGSESDIAYEVVDRGIAAIEYQCDDECCDDIFALVADSPESFAGISARVLGDRRLPAEIDFGGHALIIVGLGYCDARDAAGIEVCKVRGGGSVVVEAMRTSKCEGLTIGAGRPFVILKVDSARVAGEVQAARIRPVIDCSEFLP